MDELPDEMIIEICKEMDTSTLAFFLATSERHYRICAGILEQRRKNAFLKRVILNLREIAQRKGMALDLTRLKKDGRGITLVHLPVEERLKVDEGIYVSPKRVAEILEILENDRRTE